jgi:hypothetical protein
MDEGFERGIDVEDVVQASTKKSRRRAAARSRAEQSATEDASGGNGPDDLGYDGGDGGDDGNGDAYEFGDWDFGRRRRLRPKFDPVAEYRLKNLDEALHGPSDDATAPTLFWDGTTDQDGKTLDSIAAQLKEPSAPPTDDYYASKSGS